jgi:hypothetical protein
MRTAGGAALESTKKIALIEKKNIARSLSSSAVFQPYSFRKYNTPSMMAKWCS